VEPTVNQSGPLLELEEDDRYQVYSHAEIVAILRAVEESGGPITITFNQGKDSIFTTLLQVNPESDELILDYGPDELYNRRLMTIDTVTIITEHNQVKILFRSQRPETRIYDGSPAFCVQIPKTLIRLQRREFFRMSMPMGDAIKSHLSLSTGKSAAKVEVQVLDISCGGVALAADGQLPGVEVGKIYKGLQIELPEIGTITADVEIRNISQQPTRNSFVKRIGCQFVNLPNAIASMVQRYITKLEVARKRRS